MASKKRQAIQSGIEAQDAYYKEKNENEFKENEKRKNDPYRPNILKRFGSILLDALFIVATMAGLYYVAYSFIFPKVGYQDYVSKVREKYIESGLYIVDESGSIYTITDQYNSAKSPKDNYDEAIIYYYQNDERAIEAEKYDYYCAMKLESGYFENVDGVIKEKATAEADKLLSFYETEYKTATTFQQKDPVVVEGNNKTLLIAVLGMMSVSIISTSVFYLIIPLCTKKHVTIGQMVCGFALMEMEEHNIVNNKAVIIRYIVLLLTNFILPISLYIVVPGLFGLPIFVNAAMITFGKNNGSFHDFFSKSRILNKGPNDPFQAVETLKEQAKNGQTY